MNNLSFELFEKIFSFLDLKDKIRLRAVSRFWKERIKFLRIDYLLVTSDSNMHKDLRANLLTTKLFDSNEFVDFRGCISASSIGLSNPRASLINFVNSTNFCLPKRLKHVVLYDLTTRSTNHHFHLTACSFWR